MTLILELDLDVIKICLHTKMKYVGYVKAFKGESAAGQRDTLTMLAHRICGW